MEHDPHPTDLAATPRRAAPRKARRRRRYDRIILGHRIAWRLPSDDPGVFADIDSLFREIQRKRDVELLEAIRASGLGLGPICDLKRTGQIRTLLERGEENLEPYVEHWEAWARLSASEETVAGYTAHVRWLVPAGAFFPRSRWTKKFLWDKVGELTCANPTKRRYLNSWASFNTYLVEQAVLEANLVRSIKWPWENPPRDKSGQVSHACPPLVNVATIPVNVAQPERRPTVPSPLPRGDAVLRARVCARCGQPFEPSARQHGRLRRFCSSACKWAHWAAEHPRRRGGAE